MAVAVEQIADMAAEASYRDVPASFVTLLGNLIEKFGRETIGVVPRAARTEFGPSTKAIFTITVALDQMDMASQWVSNLCTEIEETTGDTYAVLVLGPDDHTN